MILSKNNLIIHELTSVDKAIPVLNNVCIVSDGSTVAANGKVFIVVSPVDPELKKNIPLQETEKSAGTVSSESVKEVLKNIPKDTLFHGLLEYCDFNNGIFNINDGKRKKKIESKMYPKQYINYKKAFKLANHKQKQRIVLNRKRLMKLLQVMDKVCPDGTGDSPVYIEFTENNNIILRAINRVNGQRCISLMSSYKGVESNWLEVDEWETKLIKKKIAKKKK